MVRNLSKKFSQIYEVIEIIKFVRSLLEWIDAQLLALLWKSSDANLMSIF